MMGQRGEVGGVYMSYTQNTKEEEERHYNMILSMSAIQFDLIMLQDSVLTKKLIQ